MTAAELERAMSATEIIEHLADMHLENEERQAAAKKASQDADRKKRAVDARKGRRGR
jgi:hypothetical protein